MFNYSKKIPIFLLIIGIIFVLFGAYLKIENYGIATHTLALGLILEITSILLFILRK